MNSVNTDQNNKLSILISQQNLLIIPQPICGERSILKILYFIQNSIIKPYKTTLLKFFVKTQSSEKPDFAVFDNCLKGISASYPYQTVDITPLYYPKTTKQKNLRFTD